jgi:hypothetical protein
MSDTTATTQTDSTATAATSTQDAQTDTSAADTAAEKDWQAEAEKWKQFARKHEDAAKANADKAKRFDDFEESQKTEQQKLTDDAAKAREEASATAAELARVKAAVKHGLTEDDLELLGTHGTPEEIDARAERLATRIKTAEANKPKPDFGGGDKGDDVSSKPGTIADLDNQITAATTAGNFQLAIALRQERSALIANQKKS